MSADDQADFVKKSLGAAFADANIKTKIIVYDHNTDRIDYPHQILNDPEAAKYVDGSAFHLYGGSIDDLSKVHNAFPNKNLYFTEQWVGAPGNLAGDLACAHTNYWRNPQLMPQCVGMEPCRRPLKRSSHRWRMRPVFGNNNDQWERCNTQSGLLYSCTRCQVCSPRIIYPDWLQNITGNLSNVAFKTPEGKKILIVINDNSTTQQFNISFKNKMVTTTLEKGAVGTFVW